MIHSNCFDFTDTNECLNENQCTGEHIKCNNIEGSYECICEEGFVKDSNGVCEIDVKGMFLIFVLSNGESFSFLSTRLKMLKCLSCSFILGFVVVAAV